MFVMRSEDNGWAFAESKSKVHLEESLNTLTADIVESLFAIQLIVLKSKFLMFSFPDLHREHLLQRPQPFASTCDLPLKLAGNGDFMWKHGECSFFGADKITDNHHCFVFRVT